MSDSLVPNRIRAKRLDLDHQCLEGDASWVEMAQAVAGHSQFRLVQSEWEPTKTQLGAALILFRM